MYADRFPRVCFVSIPRCSPSDPSVFGVPCWSWCVGVVCFEDVEETVDVRFSCDSLYFFLFFWLMPSFSRFLSMASSLIVLDPTMKFSCFDVHPGFLALRIMSIRFEYCLRSILSFLSM